MNPQWRPGLHLQMHLQVHHQVQRQMRPFCHLFVHLQWFFKMLNNFVHSNAVTISWTSATQVQREVYLLVQHQVHLLVHLYVYKYWSSPLGATPGVLSGAPWIVSSSSPQTHSSFFCLYYHSYFQFLNCQILHPFAPLSPVLRALSSAFHIRSHFQSQLYLLGELFVTLLCSSKHIVDCTLKNVCTNTCIIYSDGIALYACIK